MKKNTKQTTYKWVMTILTLIWLVFMFFLSHENGDESGKISGSIAEKIGQATIENENMPSYEKEIAFGNINLIIRSMAHVIVFCVLGILVLRTIRAWKIKQVYSIVFLISWSVIDEFLKLFSNGRHCDIIDIFKNLVGVAVGLFFDYLCQYIMSYYKWKEVKR